MSTSARALPRIVIVGAGFGGLWAASALARAPAQVTVIDEHNYHLFQPLLYQVATAGLSPADIAAPIRGILSRQRNAHVVLGQVVGVDKERRVVRLRDREVPYDWLVVASGARHAYFGHEEWAAFAPGLKNIDDATRLRRKILTALERAEQEPDARERQRLMTFVVVGGGATGVETAGAIAELVKVALARDFRSDQSGDVTDHPDRGRTACAAELRCESFGGGAACAREAWRRSPSRPARDALR